MNSSAHRPASLRSSFAHLAEAGHREEASDLLGRTTTALSGTPLAEWALVLKCALDSDFPGALRHFTADVEGVIQSETGAKFMADVFALMGRRKDALRWLRGRDRERIHELSVAGRARPLSRGPALGRGVRGFDG